MAEDVTIPKVGSLPKKIVIPLGIGIVGFVGWRYYKAKQDAASAATTDTSASDFAGDGTVPSVLGAISPTNSYGSDTGSTDNGNNPGRFTSNADWTNYCRSQLQGTYNDSDIVEALGNFLGSQPESDLQQRIVRASLAVGGYPPIGTYSIIPGGNVALTIAPDNVHIQSVAATSAIIAFNTVAGAASYRAYLDGISANVGSSTTSPITIPNLLPAKSYTAHVTALTSSGTAGPDSTKVTFKTPALTLPKPNTPTVSSITSSSAHATTNSVSGADGYRWYLNNAYHAFTTSPTVTLTGLHSKTQYTVSVAADHQKIAQSDASPNRTFKTK
jgi:hypothetical protein